MWSSGTAISVNFYPSTQNVSGIGGDLSQHPQSSGHQRSRPHGLHRRRIRQQVLRGPVGRRSREAVESQRRQAGEAVPGSRYRADDRRQPSFGIRQDQGGRRRRTAPSRPGNRNPGRPAGSAAEAAPPIPYVFDIPNQRKNHTAVSINAAARAPGALPITSRPATSPVRRSRIWRRS